MNILYICPRLPYPADRGDNITIYNHLRFLSKNNKITLLALTEDKGPPAGLNEVSKYCMRVEVFKRRPNFAFRNFFTAIHSAEPFTVIRYRSEDLLRRSKELIESAGFDIVHTAHYYMAQYVISNDIKIPQATAVIFDTHNIEYLLYAGYVMLTKNPVMKLLAKLESLRTKRYELALYKKFDKCLAASELDMQNIIRLSGASNIAVNPHCMDLSPREPPDNGMEEEDMLLYFGMLSFIANDDAVRFFYEEIFPLIKKEMPGVRFMIAGKSPSRRVLNLGRDPSVTVAGFVPDIRGYLKRAALIVVPLRLGGGIRMKILESWSAAKAVLSTSIGAEGVQAQDGLDIVIADSASDFAKAAVMLLRDKRRRAALGLAGYKKVRELYDAEALVKNLEKIYAATLGEKSGVNG